MTIQEHIESMIPTPRAVVESINQQVNQLEKSMKTETAMQRSSRLPWRVQKNADGFYEVWTRLDETPGSMNNYVVAAEIQFPEEAELIASAPDLAAENKRLREALEELAEDLSNRSANEFGLGNRITAEIFLDFATAARAALKGGGQ